MKAIFIVFKSGSTRLGQTVLDVVKSNAAEKQRLQQEKKVKAIEAYHNAKEAADRVVATKGIDPEKWNVADLKVILKSLKREGDTAIPSLKKDLRALYTLWKDRVPIINPLPIDEVALGNMDFAEELNPLGIMNFTEVMI